MFIDQLANFSINKPLWQSLARMAKIENENKKMVQLFQLPQPLDVLWKKQPNTDLIWFASPWGK